MSKEIKVFKLSDDSEVKRADLISSAAKKYKITTEQAAHILRQCELGNEIDLSNVEDSGVIVKTVAYFAHAIQSHRDLDGYESKAKKQKEKKVKTEKNKEKVEKPAAKKAASKAAKEVNDTEKSEAKRGSVVVVDEDVSESKGQIALIASAKGHALSNAYASSAVSAIQQMLGDKFVVTGSGVSPAEGAVITEEDFGNGIAFLAETSERENSIRATILLAFGDMILTARDSLGDEAADRLIQQVVSIHGQSKHTVQDSERVSRFKCRLFPNNDAPEGLTYTHWQELKNGFQGHDGKLKADVKAIKGIIRKVVEGNVVSSFINDEGEKIENRKPLSCNVLRAMIKELFDDEEEARPTKEKKSKGDDKEPEDTSDESEDEIILADDSQAIKYIIVDLEDVTKVYHASELKDEHFDSRFLILDIGKRVNIDPDTGDEHPFIDVSELNKEIGLDAEDASYYQVNQEEEEDDELANL